MYLIALTIFPTYPHFHPYQWFSILKEPTTTFLRANKKEINEEHFYTESPTIFAIFNRSCHNSPNLPLFSSVLTIFVFEKTSCPPLRIDRKHVTESSRWTVTVTQQRRARAQWVVLADFRGRTGWRGVYRDVIQRRGRGASIEWFDSGVV